jgi:hypothetical protein
MVAIPIKNVDTDVARRHADVPRICDAVARRIKLVDTDVARRHADVPRICDAVARRIKLVDTDVARRHADVPRICDVGVASPVKNVDAGFPRRGTGVQQRDAGVQRICRPG